MTAWELEGPARIRATQMAIQQLQAALARSIGEARSEGTSWEEVAEALGVARQSAWRKYKEEHRVKTEQRQCSFCGKKQAQTAHLVAALTGACICDECLDLAHSVMAAECQRK